MNIGTLLIQPQVVQRRLAMASENEHLADLIAEFATRFAENLAKGGSGSARPCVLQAFRQFWEEHKTHFERLWQQNQAEWKAAILSVIQPYIGKSAFFKSLSWDWDSLGKLLEGIPNLVAQLVKDLQPEQLEKHLNTLSALLPKTLDVNMLSEIVLHYGFDLLQKLEKTLAASLLNGDRSEDSFVNYAFSIQLRAIRRQLLDELETILPLELPNLDLSAWVEKGIAQAMDVLAELNWKDAVGQYAQKIIEIYDLIMRWLRPVVRKTFLNLAKPYWVQIKNLKAIELQNINSATDFKNGLLQMKNIQVITDCFFGLAKQALNDLKTPQLTEHLNVLIKLCQTDLGFGRERTQQLFSEIFHEREPISPTLALDLDTFKSNPFSWAVSMELVLQQLQQLGEHLPSLKFEYSETILAVRLETAEQHWENEIQKIENQLLAFQTNLLAFAQNTEKLWDWIQTHIWKPIQQAQQT